MESFRHFGSGKSSASLHNMPEATCCFGGLQHGVVKNAVQNPKYAMDRNPFSLCCPAECAISSEESESFVACDEKCGEVYSGRSRISACEGAD